MKHVLIAGLFTLATAASAAVLAAPGDKGQMYDRHMQRMASELQLTDQQQEQLREVHREQFEKMKALHEEREKKVESILTEEQRGKWQELREQRREGMKRHMREHRGHKRGDNAADE